ncbi:MAG TPA: NAD(+) diphosphatase [Actinotalea sp.]
MDWTRLPLARATVDRAAQRRTEPDLLPTTWADPRTQVLVVRGAALATRTGADGAVRLALHSPAELSAVAPPEVGGAHDALLLFLGQHDADDVRDVADADDVRDVADADGLRDIAGSDAADGPPPGAAYLALVLPEPSADTSDLAPDAPLWADDDIVWVTLRDVGHALDDRDAGLAAPAAGLAAWHARHRRCPLCGAPTAPADGGWLRRCTVDASDHYPRTDPAVIMAVVDDDDRLLLGHAAHWPDRRFSTLAGFVETGESLEGAVRREVAEEAGITIGDVTYQGSQPWPFPASLMLAFVARALTTDLVVDGVELTEARWFTRDELATAVASGEVLLPMRTSVALALIEDWYGGSTGGSWT